MKNLASLLRKSAALLDDAIDAGDANCAEAMQVLDALEYVPGPGRSDPDPLVLRNRRALLSLAGRCEDLFSLDMPHAPGANFFGAKFSPGAFAVEGYGAAPASAGGRGASFREAFESCLGEVAEYLSFIERLEDPLLVPAVEAVAATANGAAVTLPDAWVADALGLDPHDVSEGHDMVRARRLGSDEVVMLPLELVLRRPEERRKAARPAHSNGVAAGVTVEDAVRAGLLELIERDAMVLWWYGGNAARSISNGAVWGEAFMGFLSHCRRGSSRCCWFLEITSDIPVPVIAAFSSQIDGSRVVGGFAADPDSRQAATRAFLEMCQMELAQQISAEKPSYLPDERLSDQDRVWIARDRHLVLDAFPRLKTAARVDELSPAAMRREGATDPLKAVAVAGSDALWVDLTRPEIGIPTVRTLVPSLQGTDIGRVSARLATAMRRNGVCLEDKTDTVAPF
jgi:ribosomal protein S12 methylthiotransferase accessory factor